jgi:hypothetical protein
MGTAIDNLPLVDIPIVSSSKPLFEPIPDDQVIYIRPSEAASFSNCPRACGLSRKGVYTQAESSPLAFGTVGHQVIEEFVRGDLQDSDMADRFNELWNKALEEKLIQFTSTMGFDDLMRTGMSLMSQFPAWWRELEIETLFQEERLNVALSDNVVLTGQPDFVGRATKPLECNGAFKVAKGDVVVLDWKHPAQASTAGIGFSALSHQPTFYKVLIEANVKKTKIDTVQAIGYVDLIKKKMPKTTRGTTPYIEELNLYYRTKHQVKSAVEYALFVADNIRKGYFPQEPRMAFNSPCDGMMECEYLGLCADADTEGLVLPDGFVPSQYAA